MLDFEERGNPEYPEKNLSEQRREPTTNSTHIWRRRRDLKPGQIGGYYSILTFESVNKISQNQSKSAIQMNTCRSPIIMDQPLYIFYFTCFEVIVNSWLKQKMLYLKSPLTSLWHIHIVIVVLRLPDSWSNWNFEMLDFEERGNPEYPEKNLSEQRREPTTNSTHIWRRRRDLKPGQIGGRRVLSPLRHPCSPLDTSI